MSELSQTSVEYKLGLPEALRAQAAALYDEAIGQKLASIVQDEVVRLEILAEGLRPEFALVALVEGRLVGLLGFRGKDGSFTGGLKIGSLFDRLGWWTGLRSLVSLALLDQRPRPGELLVEGIVVAAGQRRQGVGTTLLELLAEYARKQDYQRLTVEIMRDDIDTRRLVERLGFKPVNIQHTPFFWSWLGLQSGTTLEKRL